jgi:hypothetical protein
VYYYWGFELNIASELEFPELLPHTFAKADLVIKLGKVPVDLNIPNSERKSREHFISDHEYFLEIEGICKYYVTAGSEIIVEPVEGIDSRSVRVFLLATVMAVVLFSKGLIPLHASGIIKNDKLLLFTGDSGAGKSTTLATLITKGYTVFTDDICVLKRDPDNDRNIVGVASYPMVKLWDDAVEKISNDAFSHKIYRVKQNMDKYGFFFHDQFLTGSYPIDKIFILKIDAGVKAMSVRQLSGMEAFQQIERQTYRKYLIANEHTRALHFKIMSALTASCSIFEVCRPANGSADDFVARLEVMF